jgi:hypothetical protein
MAVVNTEQKQAYRHAVVYAENEVVHVHSTSASRAIGGTTPLVLRWRSSINFNSRPLYFRERNRYLLNRREGVAGRFGEEKISLAGAGIRAPYR